MVTHRLRFLSTITSFVALVALVALQAVVSLCLAPAQAQAQARRGGELRAWTEKVLREKEADINKVLARKVVVIHRLVADKKPVFARLPFAMPKATAPKDGYFEAPHSLEFDAAFGLNYPYQRKRSISVETWLKLIRSYLDPGLLIVNDSKEKQWSIRQGEDFSEELLASKAPSTKRKVSFKRLRQFLVKVYGFEGIVIDRRGSKILALVLPPALNKSSQATLIKDSEDKLTISKRDKRVDGILQLRDFDPKLGTAIFSMVFRKKSTPIPFGTKLFIQKR